MIQFTPAVQLETLFFLNESGCIVSTREPNPSPGPRFSMIRSPSGCAWAVHADVPKALADRLDTLARDEPPMLNVEWEPKHAQQYVALLGGRVESGPAFTFPDVIPPPRDVIAIGHLTPLEKHFLGWTEQELAERAPMFAVIEEGHAVSVCFCARLSPGVAEAGVETAEPFRGRGLGPRVTAAWARSVRTSGRLPLYSTSWTNAASLAVARKLGLNTCAIDWNVYGDKS